MADPFVAAACRGLEALQPPRRLLVGVSAGADSVALLDALVRGRRRRALAGTELAVAHVDHRLRPDSRVDRDIASAHADRLGVPFVEAAVTVHPRGRGLEEAAREARYEALTRLAREHAYDALVTAHTATDQAETVLWRLARGTGLKGLTAMEPRRLLGGLVVLRPLLGVLREQTRDYCAREGLAFRDDPTNVDERPRARLRAEVLPVLERLAPGSTLRIAETASRLRADDAVLDGLAREALVRPVRVARIAALPSALRRRALALWFEAETGSRRRLEAVHVEALEALASSGRGEVELPADAVTRRVAVVRTGVLALETSARRQAAHARSSTAKPSARRRIRRGGEEAE